MGELGIGRKQQYIWDSTVHPAAGDLRSEGLFLLIIFSYSAGTPPRLLGPPCPPQFLAGNGSFSSVRNILRKINRLHPLPRCYHTGIMELGGDRTAAKAGRAIWLQGLSPHCCPRFDSGGLAAQPSWFPSSIPSLPLGSSQSSVLRYKE